MNILSLDAKQMTGLSKFILPYVIDEDVADETATLNIEVLPTECQKKIARHIARCIS